MSDKNKKTVFTDKDEELKIKQVQSVKSDGSEILVTMAAKMQEFGGSLWLVSASGDGKKSKLIDNFASPIAPALSPDGRKIAYTVFSNLESDLGFSLIVADKDDTNKMIIAKDTDNLSLPVFSPEGKDIYYLKGKDVIRHDMKNDGSEQILSLKDKEILYSMAVGEQGQLALIIGPQGNNVLGKTEVYHHDPANKSLARLTNNDLQEKDLQFSPDGEKLAFVEINQDQTKQNIAGSGTIKLIGVENKLEQGLNLETSKLIGWSK